VPSRHDVIPRTDPTPTRQSRSHVAAPTTLMKDRGQRLAGLDLLARLGSARPAWRAGRAAVARRLPSDGFAVAYWTSTRRPARARSKRSTWPAVARNKYATYAADGEEFVRPLPRRSGCVQRVVS